jgi:hypothetical protein
MFHPKFLNALSDRFANCAFDDLVSIGVFGFVEEYAKFHVMKVGMDNF